MCFHPAGDWTWRWGRVTQSSGTQASYAFVRRVRLKNQSFRKIFSYIVATHNYHPIYAKHVLGSIWVVFTLFGRWAGGVSPIAVVHKVLMHPFALYHPKIEVSEAYFS